MTAKLHWAIKDMVDAFPGTQSELAELVGVNPNSFRNKVKPNKDEVQAFFTITEFARLIEVTRDIRALQIIAAGVGYDLVPRIDDQPSADDAVFAQLYCMQHGSDHPSDMRQWLARLDIKRSDALGSIHAMTRRLMSLAEQIHG